MKRYALAACLTLPLLAGCNNSAVNTVNNDLANLAKNDIPTACTIILVAESYFTILEGKLSAAEIADEQKAARAVKVICDNPPTDLTAAFASLLAAWTAIQNDTQIPAPNPTPTPTPTARP